MVRPGASFLVIYGSEFLSVDIQDRDYYIHSESISFPLFRSSAGYVSRDADVKRGARGKAYLRDGALKRGRSKERFKV
jgi:hypothetical protein